MQDRQALSRRRSSILEVFAFVSSSQRAASGSASLSRIMTRDGSPFWQSELVRAYCGSTALRSPSGWTLAGYPVESHTLRHLLLSATVHAIVPPSRPARRMETIGIVRTRLCVVRTGQLKLVFPTIKNLEAIASFRTAAELLGARRGVDVPTTRPILVVEGKERRIILPESARS